MKILSSAELRNNYRKVADECISTGEPIYITNNGEGELVVLSIEAYREEQTRQKIKKELLRIQAEKAAGKFEYISYDEFAERMKSVPMVAEKLDDIDDYE
ncbi:MAG: type II toxin-antitoxin system Phd/YefM family antitoxin [Clostridiales Family XIII bacterium]|jgi:prevent-host-death family protein|nr:type II toxin-antitoxin system Phd/YefM family antitoxin [Clostridiales Family XIII bacterium]